MKSHFYHIQFNISAKNMAFYKALMQFLGWKISFEDHETLGASADDRQSLWFWTAPATKQMDYDQFGVNHVSIRVEKQKDVDEAVIFLKKHKLPPRFETPRHRPEFVTNKKETYYQVIFISPDNIQFEIVYVGPKA